MYRAIYLPYAYTVQWLGGGESRQKYKNKIHRFSDDIRGGRGRMKQLNFSGQYITIAGMH